MSLSLSLSSAISAGFGLDCGFDFRVHEPCYKVIWRGFRGRFMPPGGSALKCAPVLSGFLCESLFFCGKNLVKAPRFCAKNPNDLLLLVDIYCCQPR